MARMAAVVDQSDQEIMLPYDYDESSYESRPWDRENSEVPESGESSPWERTPAEENDNQKSFWASIKERLQKAEESFLENTRKVLDMLPDLLKDFWGFKIGFSYQILKRAAKFVADIATLVIEIPKLVILVGRLVAGLLGWITDGLIFNEEYLYAVGVLEAIAESVLGLPDFMARHMAKRLDALVNAKDELDRGRALADILFDIAEIVLLVGGLIALARKGLKFLAKARKLAEIKNSPPPSIRRLQRPSPPPSTRQKRKARNWNEIQKRKRAEREARKLEEAKRLAEAENAAKEAKRLADAQKAAEVERAAAAEKAAEAEKAATPKKPAEQATKPEEPAKKPKEKEKKKSEKEKSKPVDPEIEKARREWGPVEFSKWLKRYNKLKNNPVPDKYKQWISEDRIKHILLGEPPSSGGHLPPPVKGKSAFPSSWSPEKIIEEVVHISRNTNQGWTRQGWGTKFVDVRRDGITIRVVKAQEGGRIITAHPVY